MGASEQQVLSDGTKTYVSTPDFDYHSSYASRRPLRITAFAVLPDGTREEIGSDYMNWSQAESATRRWAERREADHE